MSETATGVEWDAMVETGSGDGLIYRGDRFYVRIRDVNWWARIGDKLVEDNYAPDFATAKRDAERWIMEREGRLPAPATDGGGWIACSERMPENNDDVEVITQGYYDGVCWTAYNAPVTHWRPRRVDPHADAACLFADVPPTLEQARAAARHVAGCVDCRAKLEAKGGA